MWPDGCIIFQSFDVCIIENLPDSINLPKKVQMFAKYKTKISQTLLKICQSGEISPINVTLLRARFVWERESVYTWDRGKERESGI